MDCKRHVERVRRAEGEMKPDDVRRPVPYQMTDGIHHHDDGCVQRKEIRRQRNQEVGLADYYMSALRGSLDAFYLAAGEPGPESVRQFVADDVNPHRTRQEDVDDDPTRSAGEEPHPDSIGSATVPQHEPQGPAGTEAYRQQQQRDDELAPFRHGEMLASGLSGRKLNSPPGPTLNFE